MYFTFQGIVAVSVKSSDFSFLTDRFFVVCRKERIFAFAHVLLHTVFLSFVNFHPPLVDSCFRGGCIFRYCHSKRQSSFLLTQHSLLQRHFHRPPLQQLQIALTICTVPGSLPFRFLMSTSLSPVPDFLRYRWYPVRWQTLFCCSHRP